MSKRFLPLLLALITILGSSQSGAQAEIPHPGTPHWSPTGVKIQGATPQQQKAVRDAVRLFRAAGMHLPRLEVRFSSDDADCKHKLGQFERGREPLRISICSDLAFVLPHELAHVWEHANLTDQERNEYTAFRGLESWDDPSTEWRRRGIEDASFIIQQNLTSTATLRSSAWRERAIAFERLTGLRSPLRDNR